MESKEIMILDKMPTFKSKALNTATKTIFDAVNAYNMTAAETRKTVSITLARIEKGKAYKDDGFKSLAEYAETIGLDKSLAHKMENAGRMLDSENPTVKDFSAKADYSKLAILSSADEKEVAAAIESGELTPDTTQAQVKSWKATKAAQSEKPKVLPNFEVHITFGNGNTLDFDSIAIEAIKELDGFVKIGVYKPDNGENVTVLYNPSTGAMARYTAVKVKTVKAPKKPAALNLKGFTDEMLKAAMEEYARRQAEQAEQGE